MTVPPAPGAALRHIAVEGVIGVGKTTLALRLADHLGAELLREQPADNPFLERFYAEGAAYALPAQLCFLVERARQMQALAEPEMFARTVVSDYLFDKDTIFARLNLDDEEFRLYGLIHAHVAPRVPAPHLVVWLRAPVAVLQERIRRRGIGMEQLIPAGYLERLDDAYAAHFAAYRAAPLLALDTERFHPAASGADFAELLRRIDAVLAGGAAPGLAPRPPAGVSG